MVLGSWSVNIGSSRWVIGMKDRERKLSFRYRDNAMEIFLSNCITQCQYSVHLVFGHLLFYYELEDMIMKGFTLGWYGWMIYFKVHDHNKSYKIRNLQLATCVYTMYTMYNKLAPSMFCIHLYVYVIGDRISPYVGKFNSSHCYNVKCIAVC